MSCPYCHDHALCCSMWWKLSGCIFLPLLPKSVSSYSSYFQATLQSYVMPKQYILTVTNLPARRSKYGYANKFGTCLCRLTTALALRTWGAGEVCLHEDLLLHLCNPKSETSRQGCEFRYACLQVCPSLACLCLCLSVPLRESVLEDIAPLCCTDEACDMLCCTTVMLACCVDRPSWECSRLC